MDLSILILSYNTREVTLNCLKSIYDSLNKLLLNFETLVLDNASTDGSSTAIKKQFPQVRLFESKTNLGFGKGNNYLAKHAQGSVLLFLNSDIIVLDNAIAQLHELYLRQRNKYQIGGGKLLNKDMSPQPSAGPFYSLPVVFGALFLRGDYWGLTRWSHNKIESVDWLSGACFMTTKKLFKELNGFDEKIFMYMEEVDLMYRARKRGYRVGFYPSARFVHYGALSSGGRTEPIINVFRGFLYFYRKHKSPLEFFLLQFLLRTKAAASYIVGLLLRNNYLKKTYAKAFKMV